MTFNSSGLWYPEGTDKPVKITINSEYARQGDFSDSILELVGEDYYQKHIGDGPKAFERALFFASKRAQAIKNIEDVYPVFSSVFQDADVFAKLWVANQTLDKNLHYRTVDELRMKDSDKYVVVKMGSFYNGIWKENRLNVALNDGIPDNIHGDSLLIAKRIIGNRMTSDEQRRLNEMVSSFKSYKDEFYFRQWFGK